MVLLFWVRRYFSNRKMISPITAPTPASIISPPKNRHQTKPLSISKKQLIQSLFPGFWMTVSCSRN